MKPLSYTTMITVAASLLQRREILIERCAHWKERAKTQPLALQSQAAAEASAAKVDEALKELADEAAPWLKESPEIKHLFQPAAPQPNQQETQ
jgi:hypothetical protein